MSTSSQLYSEYPSQRIAELLEELCPEGVPITKLGEVAEIGTGRSDRKDANPSGEYPFYVRSQEVLRLSSYEFDETAIIIPGEGKVGEVFHFQKGKYALHQRAYRVHITAPRLEPRFVFFHFHAKFGDFIGSRAVNGTVKSLRKPMLLDFPIPLPPLEVQREIVTILDSFTDLDAILRQEKELRQQQTEHYRRQLFTFSDDTEWSTMGEVLGLRAGKSIRVSEINSTPSKEQQVPCYGGNGVRGFVSSPSHVGVHSLIGRQGALCGNINQTSGPFFATEHAIVVTPKEHMDGSWLYHFLEFMNLNQYATKSAQPGLSVSRLSRVAFPRVSFEEQSRVGDILADFAAVEESVAKEIDLRNKQLDYYRDQLLTFPTVYP